MSELLSYIILLIVLLQENIYFNYQTGSFEIYVPKV